MIQSPICPGAAAERCDAFSAREVVEAYRSIGIDVERYFQGVETVEVYECKKTGYRFYYPFEMVGDASLYDALQSRDGYYRIKREHLVAARYIKKACRVLEVGCGVGLFLLYLRRMGIESLGLEFSDLAVRRARGAGLNVVKEDISAFAQSNEGAFDVVCSFQVLEHVPAVRSFIDGMIGVLNKGGLLIIGVPNNNPYLYRGDRLHALNLPPHHMGLWSKASLHALASCFPLDVVDVRVESLCAGELSHYLAVNYSRRYPFAVRSATKGLSMIRPARLRTALSGCISSLIEGRNTLAVYRKT